MRMFVRIALITASMILSCASPVFAQIDPGVDFTTSFPFYAQNTKLPAGSYTVRKAAANSSFLEIRSTDDKYSAFLDYVPTRAGQEHAHGDVTFHKYGNVEYLNRIWVEGDDYGVRLEPTKAEKQAASQGKAIEHHVKAKKHL